MATLISWGDSSGRQRRCDAKCYNAKHDKCNCICGGVNHGVGLQKAIENTREMVKDLLQREGTEVAQEILQQIIEFEKASAQAGASNERSVQL